MVAAWLIAGAMLLISGAILASHDTRSVIETPRWHRIPAPEPSDVPDDTTVDPDTANPDDAPAPDSIVTIGGGAVLPHS